MMRFLFQRAMKRYYIASRKQLGETGVFDTPPGAQLFGLEFIIRQNLHSESEAYICKNTPDASRSDYSDSFAEEALAAQS